MQITKSITLDLLSDGAPVIVDTKQNDSGARFIAAALFAGGVPFTVPSGAEIAFRYQKPDGTAGFYDATPDGGQAITVNGNIVTVQLVEQVLTAAGQVLCEINLYDATGDKLTSFTFYLAVQASVLTDAEIVSSDYYNVLTQTLAQALQAVQDAQAQATAAAQSASAAALSATQAAETVTLATDLATGVAPGFTGSPVTFDYLAENRIENVTAYGFTTQEGSGAPSPTNVRPIKNVGMCNAKITITGSESGWFKYENPGSGVVTYVCYNIAPGWTVDNWQNGYCTDYRVSAVGNYSQALRGPASSDLPGSISIRDDTVSTLEEFKSKMARLNPVVVYQSTEHTGKYYTGISVSQDDSYRCNIIELQAPLHEGDTLETNTLYDGVQKCVKTHAKGTVVLTGTESISLYTGTTPPIFLIYTSSQWKSSKTNNGICNWYPVGYSASSSYWLAGPSGNNPTGTVRLVNTNFSTVEELKADLAAKYAAGNPVTVEYELDQPVVYTGDPVTVSNASGAASIAGEGSVSVDLYPLVSQEDLSSAIAPLATQEQLSAALTPSVIQIPANGNIALTGNNISVARILGSMIFVQCEWQTTAEISPGTTIAQLPEEARPKNGFGTCVALAGSTPVQLYFYTTGGDVRCLSETIPSGTTLVFSAVYQ